MAAETVRQVAVQIGLKFSDNGTVKDTADKIEDLDHKVEQVKNEMAEAGIKAADSFRAAGEGAFVLARGIAFVSASSSESFTEVVKRIAMIQGAFDIMKGGIETLKGLREGMIALKVATGGATVAQLAFNTAMKANPAVIAITAVVAAVGALAIAWRFFRKAPDDVKETTESVSDLKDQMQETASAVESTRIIQERTFRLRREMRQVAGQELDLEKELVIALRDRVEQFDKVDRLADSRNAKLRIQIRFGERNVELLKEGLRVQERTAQAFQKEFDARKRAFEEEQNRGRSALEQFAALDPMQQRQTKFLLGKLKRGEKIGRAGEEIIRQFAGPQITKLQVARVDPETQRLLAETTQQATEVRAAAERVRPKFEGTAEGNILSEKLGKLNEERERSTGQVVRVIEQSIRLETELSRRIEELENDRRRGGGGGATGSF